MEEYGVNVSNSTICDQNKNSNGLNRDLGAWETSICTGGKQAQEIGILSDATLTEPQPN